MPSVGPIKLPLVSTFDPAGIVAAKAGLKELSQTKVGGGGGGSGGGGPAPAPRSAWADEGDRVFEQTRTANEKYAYQVRHLDDLHKRGAISTDTYRRAQKQALDQLPKTPGLAQRLGLGGGAQQAVAQFGGPLGGLAGLGAAGPAVAGVASVGVALAVMKLSRDMAAEDRRRSAASGLAIKDFSRMSLATQKAGLSLGDFEKAVTDFRATAYGAAGGDVRSRSIFRDLGINIRDDDTAAQMEQAQRALGGLSGAARNRAAVALYGERGIETANALANRGGQAGTTDRQSAALGEFGGMFTGAGTWMKNRFADFLDVLNPGRVDFGVAQAEAAEKQDLLFRQQQEAKGLFHQSRSPEELYGEATTRADTLGEARAFLPTGTQNENNAAARRVKIQAREARLAAASQYMTPGERRQEELSLITERDLAGARRGVYFHRESAIAEQQYAAAMAPTRSNRQNLEAQMQIGSQRWGDKTLAQEDRTSIARDLGDKLTDYAESITRSGSLAGAYDANSVAGYSQLVGAEYGMGQSQDTLKMVELLIKIAENTGKMTKAEGDAILKNIGFRTADPIFGN